MRYLCISAGRTKSISMRATIARVNVLSIMHRNLTCITDRTSDTVGAHTIRIARYRQGLAVYQQGLAVYPPGSHRRCWPARQWELQEVRVAGLHAARRRGGTSPGSSLRTWRRTALACTPVGASGAPPTRRGSGLRANGNVRSTSISGWLVCGPTNFPPTNQRRLVGRPRTESTGPLGGINYGSFSADSTSRSAW